jgi:hypothetical protein
MTVKKNLPAIGLAALLLGCLIGSYVMRKPSAAEPVPRDHPD